MKPDLKMPEVIKACLSEREKLSSNFVSQVIEQVRMEAQRKKANQAARRKAFMSLVFLFLLCTTLLVIIKFLPIYPVQAYPEYGTTTILLIGFSSIATAFWIRSATLRKHG